jgi:hypothetical protein
MFLLNKVFKFGQNLYTMIQRIQTIFLLLTSVVIGSLLFVPFAEMILGNSALAGANQAANPNGTIVDFYCYGLRLADVKTHDLIYHTTPTLILVIIITAISLITIFLYNNRTLQLRLCVYNILLMIGLIGLVAFYHHIINRNDDLGGILHHTFKMAGILPVIGIILTFQAFRKIRRDELLMQSYDRIR